MNSTDEIPCANCETTLKGTYCHHCGQKKTKDDELKVRSMILNAVHEISDVDSKFFTTLKLLILRPGLLTDEFVKGRKNSYYSPIKLFIITGVLYFMVISLFPMDSTITLDRLKQFDVFGHFTKVTETMRATIGWNINKFDSEFSGKVRSVFSQVKYFEVVIYALWFFLIFRKTYQLYYHHLIFSLHFLSFFYLRDILFLPLYHQGDIFIWIFQMGSTFVYAAISISVFYKKSLLNATLKTFMFFSLFFATSVALIFLSAYIVIYFIGVV